MKKITFYVTMMFAALSFAQSVPTTVAPTPPTRDAADVISIFSGAYTDVAGSNYNPNWGQSGFASANTAFDVQGSGDLALAYPNFNYQGNQFGSNQNVAAMEFVHIDIWTNNTTVNFFLIGLGAGNERSVTIPAATGQWTSLDIPLSDYYNAGLSGTIIQQFKYDGGDGTAASEIYVDNVYFWKTPADPLDDVTLSNLEVDGQTVPNFSGAGTDYTIELQIGTTTVPQITAATPNNAGASVQINQATSVPGTATVDVTSANGNVTETYSVNFVATIPPAAPGVGNADSEVYSIYNDTRNFTTGLTFQYDFGTVTTVDLDPSGDVNNALKSDFSVAGYGQGEGGPDDVSSYDFVNFYYFAQANTVGFRFVMIDNDAGVEEFNYQIGDTNSGDQADIATGAWTLVSIPMSYFTNLGFSDANFFQWKVDPYQQSVANGGIVYFDNIVLTQNGPLSENDIAAANFKVYPNPSANNWRVTAQDASIDSIQLFDMTGKLVKEITPNAVQTTIDGTSLNSGIYLAQISSGNSTSTVKLVKL